MYNYMLVYTIVCVMIVANIINLFNTWFNNIMRELRNDIVLENKFKLS